MQFLDRSFLSKIVLLKDIAYVCNFPFSSISIQIELGENLIMFSETGLSEERFLSSMMMFTAFALTFLNLKVMLITRMSLI